MFRPGFLAKAYEVSKEPPLNSPKKSAWNETTNCVFDKSYTGKAR